MNFTKLWQNASESEEFPWNLSLCASFIVDVGKEWGRYKFT